jgi:hypothetical protein
MFKPNSNQSAEGQTKKGTLLDVKEQQWQKPPTGKAQDWVSREPVPVSNFTELTLFGPLSPETGYPD